MHKTICFTIDVEPDFGGLVNHVYFGIKQLPKLEAIVKRYNIKLTAFVTGKTLEDNPDVLELLQSMRSEIEQHSYLHEINHRSKIKDIEKGIKIHEKLLGSTPLGYRAPQGIITRDEALFLESKGIKFDSSIFPAFFPGRFNRLSFPIHPFIIKDSSIVEIPFAVVPKIRIPIGLSYMQLLGLNAFKCLFRVFGLPDLIVYDFHSYELGKVLSYNDLPPLAKLGYYRAQNMYQDPLSVFEEFVKYILYKGYEMKYIADVYNDMKSRVPIWEWNGD
jgi:Polysaccharide deacetylase